MASGSIAHICREAGINRQQFNKYLNGHSLPSLMTTQTIATVLDVRIGDLLIDETDRRRYRQSFDSMAAQVQPKGRNIFTPGHYVEVSRSEVVDDHIYVSLCTISTEKERMRYRRKSPIHNINDWKTLWTYDGVAYSSGAGGKIFYVNSTVKLYFGSYILESASLYNEDLIGLKMTGSSNPRGTPFSAPIYFIYLGKDTQLWKHRKLLGLHHQDNLPANIKSAILALDENVSYDNGMLRVSG